MFFVPSFLGDMGKNRFGESLRVFRESGALPWLFPCEEFGAGTSHEWDFLWFH